jgi:hypothetical protein
MLVSPFLGMTPLMKSGSAAIFTSYPNLSTLLGGAKYRGHRPISLTTVNGGIELINATDRPHAVDSTIVAASNLSKM